jgi:E3 ubiquitin-protein ligase RNF5
LYCWPCLHQWLDRGSTKCPECKAEISRESIIPLYGHGHKHAAGAEGAPPEATTQEGDSTGYSFTFSRDERRRRQRGPTPPRPVPQREPSTGEAGGDNASTGMFLSAGFGLFPALFGLHVRLGGGPLGGSLGRSHFANEEQANQMMMGIIIVFVLYILFL